MFGSSLLLIASLLGIGQEPSSAASRFEAMAKNLEFFPTGEFAWRRAHQSDYELRHVPDLSMKVWLKTHATLTTNKDDPADLIRLLDHQDPKVRTLAMAALFERLNPKYLPQFAAMIPDKQATAPRIQGWGGIAPAKPVLEPQTVGDVASIF